MSRRRVVITGMGVVNSLGIGVDAYFEQLLAGTVGVGPITAFDASGFPCRVAAEAQPFKVNQYIPKSYRKSVKLMSRDIQLAVVAADQAIRHAGLCTKGTEANPADVRIDPTRSGVNIGAGLICCELPELAAAAEHAVTDNRFDLKKWGQEGMACLTPLWLLKYLPNMLSCHISILHDLQGPSNSITCGEASGLLAIGEAYYAISHDKADLMIAGGAESKVNAIGLIRQFFLDRLSLSHNDDPEQACRPFDAQADGMVIGEGGAIVTLESLEHAQARGATIYGEITGFGASNNFTTAFVEPEQQGTGIQIAIEKAMRQAQLQADRLGLLVPFGAAKRQSDKVEATAVATALGPAASQTPVYASKSQIGNTGAAAAANDLIVATMSLHSGSVPPTQNCTDVPPDYKLNVIREAIIDAQVDHALTSSYTFGGQTAAMVISRFNG